jgi:hypothetical protein
VPRGIDDAAMKYSHIAMLAVLATIGAVGQPARLAGSTPTSASAADLSPATPAEPLNAAADATTIAVRVDPPSPGVEQTTGFGSGLHGRAFAPQALTGCDEMSYYRAQWGLPASFDTLGWRESGCRNEETVRTFCCYGYWQLYISTFVRDLRAGPRLAAECSVYSSVDVDGNNPADKQRQACAAAVMYSIQGVGAWSV